MSGKAVPLGDGRTALIRRLTDGDSGLLFTCFQGYGDEARRDFAPHPFSREVAEDICSRAGTEKTALRFIVTEGEPACESPLGYAFLWFLDQEVPSLGVGLVDRAVGRGLGRHVVTFLLEQARGLGCDRIELSVMARNKRARALYESLSFSYCGNRTWNEHCQGWMLKMRLDLQG